MTKDYFSGVEIDAKKRERIRAMSAAEKSLVIFFTPRSGSSWLTDVLAQTNSFGRANELFNPNFLPKTAVALQATTLDDYIYAAQRRLAVGGVFSFEITMHQLNVVFESPKDFQQRFGNSQFVWLTRRDIVAQAVSLNKMVNAGIAHSPNVTHADITAADRSLSYSDAEIRKWLDHIRRAETQTEDFLASNGIQPLRLVYETMIQQGAERTLQAIASHIGVPSPQDFAINESHSKVGTPRNEEFATRFRRRNWLLVKKLEWQRQKLTAR